VSDAGQARLHVVPCTLDQANAAVSAWHRHHSPMGGPAHCVAVATPDGVVHGVAILGRPCSPSHEDGWTIEVRRVATDGMPNACSALYGASRRIAMALGYRLSQTFTMEHESGASLRGAGWTDAGRSSGSSGFSRRQKPRTEGGGPRVVGDQAASDRERQQGVKILWRVTLPGDAPAALVWPQRPTQGVETLGLFGDGEGGR